MRYALRRRGRGKGDGLDISWISVMRDFFKEHFSLRKAFENRVGLFVENGVRRRQKIKMEEKSYGLI